MTLARVAARARVTVKTVAADVKRVKAVVVAVSASAAALAAQGLLSGPAVHWVVGVCGTAVSVLTAAYAVLQAVESK